MAKNDAEMLAKAMQIASQSENARVAFLAESYDRMILLQKTLLDNLNLYGDATYCYRTCRYTHESGGSVTLGWATEKTVAASYAGWQVTHLFVTRDIDYRVSTWMMERIRSIYSFETPMGRYDPWGCVIRMDY